MTAPSAMRLAVLSRGAGLALLLLAAPLAAEPLPRALPLVLTATAEPVTAAGLSGVVAPRVSVTLGFPLGGTLLERPVDAADRVAEGALLARLDPLRLELSLEAARADLASAEAQALNAQSVLERQIGMNAGNMVSDSIVDLARLQARTRQAQADAARAQAQVAEDQLADARLLAGFDAIVTAVHGEVGEVIGAGQPVLTLARPDLHDAILDVSELQARATAIGDPWEIRLEVAPAIRVIGHVREIAPQADQGTRSHRLRITLESPPEAFRFGSTLLARPLPSEGSGAEPVLVPASALREGQVWVVNNGRAEPRAVESGPAGPAALGMLLVSQGLAAGERVIVAGLGALSPGMELRVE